MKSAFFELAVHDKQMMVLRRSAGIYIQLLQPVSFFRWEILVTEKFRSFLSQLY